METIVGCIDPAWEAIGAGLLQKRTWGTQSRSEPVLWQWHRKAK